MHAPRMEYGALHRAAPALAQSLMALDKAAHDAGLDPALPELMKLRVSQMNGCAFCLQYHTNELGRMQADPAKLAQVAAWREAAVFSAEERAVLAWAEAATGMAPGGIPDAVHEAARQALGEAKLAALTAAVVAINGWNRVAVAWRFTPPAAQDRVP
ncbi:MAG TPA: carboxymuconolactone decarboxylase family protein [Crenalkalicoccus sp.]|nr:carboxymuconolactone decarboxylase family protein [Crenalkalicoccus sp.]